MLSRLKAEMALTEDDALVDYIAWADVELGPVMLFITTIR
jgi:hypothetical protein